jgi:hypothetical protein
MHYAICAGVELLLCFAIYHPARHMFNHFHFRRPVHADEAGCKKHAAMGFSENRGKALDQLVELAKKTS